MAFPRMGVGTKVEVVKGSSAPDIVNGVVVCASEMGLAGELADGDGVVVGAAGDEDAVGHGGEGEGGVRAA